MKKILVLFCTIILLTACATHEDEAGDDLYLDLLVPLEVEILTHVDHFAPHVEGVIEVQVTHGDENVADADEVLLEIWKDGLREEAENLEAENLGEGRYILAHTFPEEGIYYVIAHVTARGSHTMPKKEFIVK